MIPSQTLRELGAATRTFRTVKGAMLWYVGQLAARLRVNRDYEWGSTPRCEEARHVTNATFAKVANCLRGEPGERVLWLVAWYETTEGDGGYLAEQANLTRWAFVKRCKKTERTIRVRMEEAGILEKT
jgi:hypothetical protein